MNNENLNKKDIYDRKRGGELRARQRSQNFNLFKRLVLWVGVMVVVVFAVWGLTQYFVNLPAPQTALLIDAISANDWVDGNKESKTILVEYSDFQCPACGAYYPFVERLIEEYGDNFQFVYRHFPLPQHANAKPAAYAAEAAGRQGKFWEMYSLIFESQSNWSNSKNIEQILIGFAGSLELDLNQFTEDYKSEAIKIKVEQDYQSGLMARVNSTPTFFLNGKQVQPRSFDEFVNLIEQANAASL
ncbi:MAG: thioredoxin domain-containing protein [bacterium]|nr:thioredoxin domain-containing protein [bacterium]